MLVALVSAKGSPGASTAGLAFALTWPGPVLLAECDPAGGSVLSGFLAKFEITADRGVLPLAGAAMRGRADVELPAQMIDLDPPQQQRMVLPGISDPAQAGALAPAWDALGHHFAGMPATVVADCGRLSTAYPPVPLLRRADLVLVAMRAQTLRDISPVVPAVAQLRRELGETSLGLLVIGRGVSHREIEKNLLTPVMAELAWDPRMAAALCGEGRGRRRGPLMRSSAEAYRSIGSALAARRRALAPVDDHSVKALPGVRP